MCSSPTAGQHRKLRRVRIDIVQHLPGCLGAVSRRLRLSRRHLIRHLRDHPLRDRRPSACVRAQTCDRAAAGTGRSACVKRMIEKRSNTAVSASRSGMSCSLRSLMERRLQRQRLVVVERRNRELVPLDRRELAGQRTEEVELRRGQPLHALRLMILGDLHEPVALVLATLHVAVDPLAVLERDGRHDARVERTRVVRGVGQREGAALRP